MNINQLKYYFSIARVAPFLPLLYYQAKHIKNTMPDLPQPDDIEMSKEGDSFHVLSIGESSIASIGAKSQITGLTGCISALIKRDKNLGVSYEVVAKSGFTAGKVKDQLLGKIKSTYTDLILIGLGANDAFQLSSPKNWRKNLSSILDHLGRRFGETPIVFIHMPPILEFPIFTPLLKYFVHRQICILKKELISVTEPYKHVHMIDDDLTAFGFVDKYQLSNKVVDDFYSDGVHPSELTYKFWAQEIYNFTIQKQLI
jgi:lysophospholipase L1-like esterase